MKKYGIFLMAALFAATLFVCGASAENNFDAAAPDNSTVEELEDGSRVIHFDYTESNISPDELLTEYLYASVGSAPGTREGNAFRNLNLVNKGLYLMLKEECEKIVAGERTSTVFQYTGTLENYFGWTAEELGVSQIVDIQSPRPNYWVISMDQEAHKKIMEMIGFADLLITWDALCADCPDLTFWRYGRLLGQVSYDSSYYERDGIYYGTIWIELSASVSVSPDYQDGDAYTINTEKLNRVHTAIENANTIVQQSELMNDEERLYHYGSTICALVEYDHAALEESAYYGDPWQIINVFDNDPETNVVCDGYAKAFQYLCDRSVFRGDTSVYYIVGSVSYYNGDSVRTVGHAWNHVNMNGQSYLIDVTNSDVGDQLTNEMFMVQPSFGTLEDGYYFTPEGQLVSFKYNHLLYPDEVLVFPGVPAVRPERSGECGPNLTWSLEDGILTISGYGEMYDYAYSGYHAPWYHMDFHTVVLEGVSHVGRYAFHDADALETIDLSNTKSIGDYALCGCDGLQSVVFAQSASLGGGVCCDCSSLKNVVLPQNLTSIQPALFSGCTSLETVSLPEGITTIQRQAFSHSGLTELVLPDSVTTIEQYAFWHCTSFRKINIPEGVVSIGYGAFGNETPLELVRIPNGCKEFNGIFSSSGVKEVILPDWITEIPDEMFSHCSNLERVVFPEQITRIGEEAFIECSSLREFTIPENVTSIGARAFYGTGLERITIPDSVQEIENNAFVFCASLKSVVLPKNLETLSDGIFERCRALETIVIPSSLKTIGFVAFSGCSSLKEINLPSGVTTIGAYAFEDCTSLSKITIPDTVTEMSSYVFRNCPLLKRVVIPASVENMSGTFLESNIPTVVFLGDYPKIGNWKSMFDKNTSVEIHYDQAKQGWDSLITYGSMSIIPEHDMNCYFAGYQQLPADTPSAPYETVFKCSLCGKTIHQQLVVFTDTGKCGENVIWLYSDPVSMLVIRGQGRMDDFAYDTVPWEKYQRSILSVYIEPGVEYVGTHAFRFCYYLTDVSIPDTVTALGDYSFIGCSSLQTVSLPERLVSMGQRCFSQCSSLITLTIPQNVTILPEYCLDSCTALEQVILPEGLVELGEYCFSNCQSLASITIPRSTVTMGYRCFYGCNSLMSVTISEGVSNLPNECFQECESLSQVSLPSSLVSIGNSCFAFCSGLETIVIPNSVSNLGDSLFKCCSSLKAVSLPESVNRIPAYCFFNCVSLTQYAIPSGISEVGEDCFFGCSGLKSIVIPETVVKIGNYGFQNCPSLETVYYSGSAEQANKIVIGNRNTSLTKAVWYYHFPETQLTCLTLPASLTVIEEEAFQGVDVEKIVIPSGVTTIASRSFADCGNLKLLSFSGSPSQIADDILENCDGVFICAASGSTAEAWAFAHGYSVIHP